MRILLLTLYFDPDVAANAVIMTELAEELASRGHQLTVVTAFPHYASNIVSEAYKGKIIHREFRKNIRILRTYLYTSPKKERFLVRLLNYVSFNILSTLVGIFSGPQDLILAPSPPLTIGFSAHVIGRLKRIPYIYNVQDINPDVLIKLGILKNPLGITFSKSLEQFVYRNARHITVLTEGFRKNLLSKGMASEKLSVIPNFIDAEFVRPQPHENKFRDLYNLHGKFLVIYAGNLGHSQNLEHVLMAAKQFQDDSNENIVFLIVGNGSRKESLKSISEKNQLSNVRLIPFQPRDMVPFIFSAADVSLITLKAGIASSSMPSKLYTIMASGRPVVAAVDLGSDIWKLIDKAQCGISVPPENSQMIYDAVLKLYTDPVIRSKFGENGRRYVTSHFTRDIIGEQYHQLVMSIIA